MISADLGQQLERFVARLVEAGRYNSKSEVLREGVRLIQEREARLAALKSGGAKPAIGAGGTAGSGSAAIGSTVDEADFDKL